MAVKTRKVWFQIVGIIFVVTSFTANIEGRPSQVQGTVTATPDQHFGEPKQWRDTLPRLRRFLLEVLEDLVGPRP